MTSSLEDCSKTSDAGYTCMKHGITVSEKHIQCRDPEIYCKFRSSCPIWFMDKKGGGSIDEDTPGEASKTEPADRCDKEKEIAMPNELYECEQCNHSFEKPVLQASNDCINCPECKGSRVKRLVCSDSFMSDTSIGACCINAPKGFS